jgi:hypothetical protein
MDTKFDDVLSFDSKKYALLFDQILFNENYFRVFELCGVEL